jgi:hypothetical protein
MRRFFRGRRWLNRFAGNTLNGTSRRQSPNLSHHLRGARWLNGLRWRRQGHPAALAHYLLQSVPLIWLEIAQLILNVIAVLARKIHQLLGVDVQFTGQGIDSNFLTVLVQAG